MKTWRLKAISWGYAGGEGSPNTIYVLKRGRELFLQGKAEVEKWDKHGKTRDWCSESQGDSRGLRRKEVISNLTNTRTLGMWRKYLELRKQIQS